MIIGEYIDLTQSPGRSRYLAMLNRCYHERYSPDSQVAADRVLAFGVWCEQSAGIRLHLQPQTLEGNYSLQGITILDPARFNWWQLQWS
jgi:hypothetical protein